MCESDKPFACTTEGCKMTFTNEDHLNVHKTKHNMALNLEENKNIFVADQTPTPTRFIRNCEEVGLFQDLQNVNPFEETFKKAVEFSKNGILHVPEQYSDDTLHTPHILPHITEQGADKSTAVHENGSIFAIDEDDDDEDVLRICDANECNVESVALEKPASESRKTVSNVIIQSNLNVTNICNRRVTQPRENVKSELKQRLEKRRRNEINLKSTQGVLITPIPLEKLRNADSATILIKRNHDSFDKPPRIRTAKPNNRIRTHEVDEKKELREINRVAQIRSRERKKRWLKDTQDRLKQLEADNAHLVSENEQLKVENCKLKSVLLYHKSCNVSTDPKASKEIAALLNSKVTFLRQQPKIQKKCVSIKPYFAHNINLTTVQVPVVKTGSNDIKIQVASNELS